MRLFHIDRDRSSALTSKGYKILVIWEDDLKNDYENELLKAQQFLERKYED